MVKKSCFCRQCGKQEMNAADSMAAMAGASGGDDKGTGSIGIWGTPAGYAAATQQQQQPQETIKLLLCSNCHTVAYCSKACQKIHWNNGNHKEYCKAIKVLVSNSFGSTTTTTAQQLSSSSNANKTTRQHYTSCIGEDDHGTIPEAERYV